MAAPGHPQQVAREREPSAGADSSAERLVERFLAALDENLAGRRVLPRAGQGTDLEPATLAQLPSMRRVQDVLAQVRRRGGFLAEPAAQIADILVGALVGQLAAAPDTQVAAWPAAEAALNALERLLTDLDDIAARANPPSTQTGAESAGEGVN